MVQDRDIATMILFPSSIVDDIEWPSPLFQLAVSVHLMCWFVCCHSTCQLCASHKRTYWMFSMAFSFSLSTKTLTFACSVSSISLKHPFLKCYIPFCCTMMHLSGLCCNTIFVLSFA